MKIAFNPSTVEALIAPPNNKDITFDLRGQNIFARGVKFCGTDTNTWRDIKINNVSIGSNTLDLRDGDNTTLTNINGVVTINSTWRPVVDNLTSDSTTSSLSAKQGKILKSLIDGKSDSDHNHDDRYLRLTGGIMQLGEGLKFHADENYFGTYSDARIISLLDNNDKVCDGGLIIDERTTLDGKEYVTELLRIRDSEFKWRGSNILHSGNSYINGSTITINGSSLSIIDLKVTLSFVSSGYTDFRAVLITAETSSSSAGYTPSTVTGQTFITNALQLSPQAGNLYLKGSAAIGTTNFNHKLNVNGDIGLLNTGSIRNLAIGGGIYWNPYVESASDGSDAASITVVKSGVAGGTTLVLSLMNDANDTILFQTNGSARLYHNSYPILTTLNTYVNNNKGYINGIEITLVNNAMGAYIATLTLYVDTLIRSGYLAGDYTNRYDTLEYMKAAAKYLLKNYSNLSVFGTMTPNALGFFTANIYGAGFNSNGNPEHITIHYYPHGGNIINCGTSYGNWYWNTVSRDEHTHSWQSITDKIVGGNEFNIINSGFSNSFWFNYLPIDNRDSSAYISLYIMGNGNRGLASVYAKSFKVDGQGCMWKDARDYAPFCSTFNSGWEPILDIKTVSGDWAIGSYDAIGNHLVFAYESDSDYNAGVNGTANYWLSPGGEFKINTLRLAGPASTNMGVGSPNPKIIFAENDNTLQVALTYTDWDDYRPTKGLKVHSYDGSDDSNVWFEVLGYNYSSGYIKNGSSDAYVLLGGGGHKAESSLNVANADTVDGFHATSGNNKPWGTIPVIHTNGWMDIGKQLEFHYDNTTGSDYSTVLMCLGNYSNIVNLPSESGTLALTSQVLTWKSLVIDMRNYDESYWHPVTVPLPYTGYNKIKVSVLLNIGDKPSWAEHPSGITCNMEIWATASGWGTTSQETICLNYTYRHCSLNPCGWMLLSYSSLGVLFLRGGSRYIVYTDFDATFTPHDKTYTWINGSYSLSTGGPYTNCPGLNFNKNKIYANLDGNATTATDSDTLDGYHASGLLTALSNSNNGISVTVGGTTKSVSNISVNYAASAGSANSAIQATNLTPENTPHYFRDPYNSAWRGGMYWGSDGSESMSFVAVNSGTRFQFVGGSDIANWTSSTWQSVTPYLTIYSSGIVTSGSVTATNGFIKSGSSDSYVLLGGGGHQTISSLSVNYASSAGNADTLDGNHASAFAAVSHTHPYLPLSGAYITGTNIADMKVNIRNYFNGKPAGTNCYVGSPNIIYNFLNDSAACDANSVCGIMALNPGYDNYNHGHFLVSHYGDNRIGMIGLGYLTWYGPNWFAYTSDIPTVTDYYWANVKVSASSNTQTQPSVNTIYANNWFRSQGDSGWYNESYGGGIWMNDSNWIRTYNGKGFYCDNLIYSSNSIRMGNILLGYTDEINNSANGSLHLNYRNSGNITLCQGGGSVGIGTTSPAYKLDVNGLMRASGFHHSSANSDNYILLAGGGYKSFGGDYDNPIFLGYLDLEHGNDGTISSSFYCLGYSVSFTYTRGGNYCKISIPDTSYQVFYIRAAIASVNYSGGGMDTWTGNRRGDGSWWLHCYASDSNEVRVKGFRQKDTNNDSWWGGNPLIPDSGGANRITVCIFGYVTFR